MPVCADSTKSLAAPVNLLQARAARLVERAGRSKAMSLR
jgi:hypothetical protein